MKSHEITVIEAGKNNTFSAHELWVHREIFFLLIWRDILVRYKQTVIGVAWVVLRPALTMAVFSLLFGKIAGFSSSGVPYPLMVLSGLIVWQFFSDSLFFGSGSLVGNAAMISKVYFPRLYIPASSVVCCILDFGVSLSLLIPLLFYYGFTPSVNIVLLPLFFAWLFTFTLAITVLIAALMVPYRDFRYIVAFGLQFGLYISPVGFASSIIPFKWRLVFSLNPLVGIIDGFRWSILGTELFVPGVVISLIMTGLIALFAFSYFKNAQETFADVV